jgi:hypothetical protein
MLLGVQNLTSVVSVLSSERTNFYREIAVGMYSALRYAFGQVYSEKTLIFHLQQPVYWQSFINGTYAHFGSGLS